MKLLDTNRYYLKGTSNRFLHVATVQDSVREFMAFWDVFEKKFYIEEVTGGSLSFIKDEDLVKEIDQFLFRKNITNLAYGDFTPDIKK